MTGLTQLSTGGGFPDVVVTGVAMTTALATDADSTWKKLLDGQSGIRKLEDPFVEQYDLPVRIGGHLLEDFDHELTRVELRRLSYLQKMSTVLSRRVWHNAGSPEPDAQAETGVITPALALRSNPTAAAAAFGMYIWTASGETARSPLAFMPS